MKKAAAIFLTVLLGVCLLMPLNAFGEDVPTPPAADAAQPPVEETLPTEAATEAPTQIAKPELDRKSVV